MDNIDNKELLLAAIEDYDLYSMSQRQLLKILITIEIDNIASVKTQYLMSALNLSKAAIYKIIKQLEGNQLIKRVRLKGTQHDSFQINKASLIHIVRLYNNKKLLANKK